MIETAVASPCVSVCTLDASGELCVGCYRTTAEIAAWSLLSDEQRRAVLARTEQRMARALDGDYDLG